jgi:hypothetical protein
VRRPGIRPTLLLAALLAVVLTASLAPPPPSAGAATPGWLCRPDRTPDVCREPLDTTVFAPDGSSRVVAAKPDDDAPVDCFYVYPTVSNQLGPTASGDADPEVQGIARFQAQRFAQECRVYAPLYRQGTVPGIFLGGFTDETREIAYGDVLAAWRSYLAQDNRGRGIVLIGHSQGTGVLRRLIREQIDPDPALRRRLVSALLLGGNVLTKKGSDRGGDFQNVPLCRADDQTGCVVAYSTFDETPPSDTRFGRAPTTTDRLTGLPPRSDVEVACTNPASLAENRTSTFESQIPSAPFPVGLIGLGVLAVYGGPPPTAPTPWLQPRDRYAGRCETVNGARVLLVHPQAGSRDLNAFPDAGWGLHLVDVNGAMGDLRRLVRTQTAAYRAAATAPAATVPSGRPRVRLTLGGRTRRGADGRRCVASAVAARIAGADRALVRGADFRLNRRTVRRDRAAPFTTTLARRRLRAGRLNRIDALVTLADGRRRRVAGTVRTCPR